jgi:hypothetical protein
MADAPVTKSLIPQDAPKSRIRWFSSHGCVVERDLQFEVFVGGMLVGAWDKNDTRLRNALVVTFAAAPDVHLERTGRAKGGEQDEQRGANRTSKGGRSRENSRTRLRD